MTTNTYPEKSSASFSIASIIAIVCAVLTFTSGAALGMIFAIVAIIAGLVGVGLALSPSKRGGILSTLAIGGGLLGVVAAVIKLVMLIF